MSSRSDRFTFGLGELVPLGPTYLEEVVVYVNESDIVSVTHEEEE